MELDLDAVAWNYRETVKAVGPDAGVMAVVKDESYGLGAVPIARRLAQEGCELFCVADLREAMELREAGVTGRILMLLPVSMEYLEIAAENRIEFLVLSADQAEAYDNAAAALESIIMQDAPGQSEVAAAMAMLTQAMAGAF